MSKRIRGMKDEKEIQYMERKSPLKEKESREKKQKLSRKSMAWR